MDSDSDGEMVRYDPRLGDPADQSYSQRPQSTGNSHMQKLEQELAYMREELALYQNQNQLVERHKALAKKNRDLAQRLEHEKSKTAQALKAAEFFQQTLAAMEHQTGLTAPELPDADMPRALKGKRGVKQEASPPAADDNLLAIELKDARLKCRHATERLAETKAQLKLLQDELKRTQTVLQKEIGSDVPLERVLDEAGRWRGRAQEISLLRAKVKEMDKQQQQLIAQHQQQLAQIAARLPPSSDGASVAAMVQPMMQPGAVWPTHPSNNPVDRNEDILARSQAERVEERQRLEGELRRLGEQDSKHRQRLEALKARCTTLENDGKGLKEKLRFVLGKSDADDQLIDSLRGELEKLRKAVQSNGRTETPAATTAKFRALETELRRAQEALNRANQNKLVHFNAAVQDWDQQEREHKYQILSVENNRRQDLLELQAQRLREFDEKNEALAQQNAKLEDRIRAYELRAKRNSPAEMANAAGAPLSKKDKDLLTVAELRDRLVTEQATNARNQAAYETRVAAMQSELQVVRDMLGQLRTAHQTATQTMREQFQAIQQTFS